MTADDDDPAMELWREAVILARKAGMTPPLSPAQRRYLDAFEAWLASDQGDPFSATYQERERRLLGVLDEAGLMPWMVLGRVRRRL